MADLVAKREVLERVKLLQAQMTEKIRTKDGQSLLDKTLIVCMGEFGRTPGDITVNKGRDHHRFVVSGLFAGGGVAGGRAVGATDDQGAKSRESRLGEKAFDLSRGRGGYDLFRPGHRLDQGNYQHTIWPRLSIR